MNLNVAASAKTPHALKERLRELADCQSPADTEGHALNMKLAALLNELIDSFRWPAQLTLTASADAGYDAEGNPYCEIHLSVEQCEEPKP